MAVDPDRVRAHYGDLATATGSVWQLRARQQSAFATAERHPKRVQVRIGDQAQDVEVNTPGDKQFLVVALSVLVKPRRDPRQRWQPFLR